MFAEIDRENSLALPILLYSLSPSALQNRVSRPEGAKFHQILWILEGTCSFSVGEEQFLLASGEGVFTRSGQPHSYEGEGLRTAWCTFMGGDGLLDHLGIGDSLRFTVPPFLNRETEQLFDLATGSSTALSRSAATYTFLSEFFTAVLSETESVPHRVYRLLEQRYAEPLTLEGLAEEMGTNRFALCRLYRQERGTTIMEDLNRIRIRKAKKLLRYTSDSVEEIGRACGFESPSYFGKRFRQLTDLTPLEYRRSRR